VRSAGSKGLVDLIALKQNEVLLIQCKSKPLSKQEEIELKNLKQKLGYKVLVVTRKNRKVEFIEL
jgi:Holliday junction resolvase